MTQDGLVGDGQDGLVGDGQDGLSVTVNDKVHDKSFGYKNVDLLKKNDHKIDHSL